MSGVSLRCPHCGTTRATPGECEACHEAAVRYYCTNHAPGRWLDAPRCSDCGARFGDPSPAATTARGTAAGSTSAERVRRPAGAPSHAPPPLRSVPPAGPRDGSPSPSPAWRDRPAAEVGFRRGADRAPPPVDVDLAPARRVLGGCLVRLVLLALFALVMLSTGIFLLGGSLLRLFVPY